MNWCCGIFYTLHFEYLNFSFAYVNIFLPKSGKKGG
nr:MAG TPA: hypothetical protein [Caudoviricetes sp.]